uniref:NADH-ubiquinone oxidoreductase chain 2 n=1 Tax=Cyphoderris monstrosa TaxID=58606 RepID=A0A0N7ART4_9ORTH|nr:NADH dehydrogenase subunit 2 [Cyphoderris monstrosa]AJW76317.1 NADH dehydrogenase subunit 2 [Cyphoderris monstrosa]
MPNNPTKLLFISTLISGTLISTSANSWLGAWMGLEINLLSFIPLMTNPKNIMTTEASLKYFLVQALASTILLFSIIFMHLSTNMTILMNHDMFLILISSTLLLKMGAAPFHFWFPGTMEGLSWINCLILMTWQKIAPLMLMSYVIKMDTFTSSVIILSVTIGSLGGLNQTSLRKLMAYSSINHLGWMMAAMISGENLWELYFMVYSFLSSTLVFMFNSFQMFHINQGFLIMNKSPIMKFCIFSTFLSLGGLPPFLGFMPKWLIIQNMTELGLILTVTAMVVMTLITLFYYLRISFSAFLLTYSEIKWTTETNYKNTFIMTTISLSMMSTLGLLMCTIIFNMI